MKTLITVLSGLFLLIISGCEITPQSHEVLNKEYNLDQILNIAEVDYSSLDIKNDNLISSIETLELPPKKHINEIKFKPLNWNKELVIGTIQIETEFGKYLINEREYWLPQMWKVLGYADSLKTKMIARPNFELYFSSDHSLVIRQYSIITLGDINLKISSSAIEDEKGNIIYAKSRSGSGATSSQSVSDVFESKKGELSRVENKEFRNGFEDEEMSVIFQKIFDSNLEIIGSSNQYFE